MRRDLRRDADTAYRRSYARFTEGRLGRLILAAARPRAWDTDPANETIAAMARLLPDIYRRAPISASGDLVRILETSGPILIAQPHTGHLCVSKFLADRGVAFGRIAANADGHLAQLKRIGVDTSGIVAIARGPTSMLAMRDCVRSGLPICCCVDERDPDGGGPLINPGMFELARRLDLPVVFVRPVISRDGAIELQALPPIRVDDARATARAFVDFADADPAGPRPHRVAPDRA